MSSPQYSTARPAGREHFPLLPSGFIAIRVIQLVLAIIVLGLSAYSVSLLSYDGNQLILAVAVLTFIAGIYFIVAHFAAPVIFNYWAVLGLDIFFVIMWLCAFALQAARVASAFKVYNAAVAYYSNYYGESVSGTSTEKGWLDTQAAGAALGGIEFLLFIIALVLGSIALHRHRAAGLHCMPGQAPGPATTTATGTELPHYGGEKTGPAPAYAPQQPGYAPQQQQAYPPQTQQAYPPQQPQQAYPPQAQQQAYPAQAQQAYPPQQQPQQTYYPPQHQQAAPVPAPAPAPAQSPAPVSAQSPVPSHSVISEAPAAEHNHGYVGGPVPTQLE